MSGRKRTITDEQVKKMKELHKEGYNYTQVSRELDINPSTVRYWLNEKARKYIVNRLHNDPKFKDSFMQRVRENNRIMYAEGRTWGQRNPEKLKEIQKKRKK